MDDSCSFFNTGSSEKRISQSMLVLSFYKFAQLPDHARLQKLLQKLCRELHISGSIVLSYEGINGSICGTKESLNSVLEFIQCDDRLSGLRYVESPICLQEGHIHNEIAISPFSAVDDVPFRWNHIRVRLKKEIVALGMVNVSPIERVGRYVTPKGWNALISDPDTVVIDVRNTYETRIGKFKGAIVPHTMSFREFPSWVDDQFKLTKSLHGSSSKESEKMAQKIAMYCTGGIRCEKASSFLLRKGFQEVYHLEGGILKYLELVPKSESLWEGECFVFDRRVAVGHGFSQGTFKLCYGCKQPVSREDMKTTEWECGVSCPHCYMFKSEQEKDRARARQTQFQKQGFIGGQSKMSQT